MKIDAHQHFWAYQPEQYPWIAPDSPLHRDWLPGDLAPLLKAEGIDGCIAVQARQTLEESHWLLGLADQSPIIKGVVGWLDLRSIKVTRQLAQFAPYTKFVGVRHVVQDETDDAFLLQPDFVRGIAHLAEFDLAYDLLIYPRQLAAAIELVRHFPQQRFVVDHVAKPAIKSGALEPWESHLRELAASENVMCKVSGLVTEADHAAWKPEDFKPHLDIVFEVFGEDRLMFASDWPVCLSAASYPQVCAVVRNYTEGFSDTGREKLWGGNAARFYRLA